MKWGKFEISAEALIIIGFTVVFVVGFITDSCA